VKQPRWIDCHALRLLHTETLTEHGGLPGLRDEGAFQSALTRPQNILNYEPKADLARLAAAYGFGMVRSHPFNDGNKRVGFLAIGLFLAINKFQLSTSEVEAAETIMELAAGRIKEVELAEWIRLHIVRL
jgi:death-on-curing protein